MVQFQDGKVIFTYCLHNERGHIAEGYACEVYYVSGLCRNMRKLFKKLSIYSSGVHSCAYMFIISKSTIYIEIFLFK